jgi:hypothetical protein
MQIIVTLASALTLTMAAAASHAPHWSYEGPEGPEHWGALSPEFAACRTGHTQSPIDHGSFEPKHAVAIATDYHAGPLTLLHNGHTVQANFAPGSTLTSGGHSYPLAQVHFHTPSEEAFNGKHYPMVAHFVHKDAEGHLAGLLALMRIEVRLRRRMFGRHLDHFVVVDIGDRLFQRHAARRGEADGVVLAGRARKLVSCFDFIGLTSRSSGLAFSPMIMPS